MAIVQISKIQVRTGDESDLPQLDIGEIGFTTDTKKVFIGNDPLLDPPVGIQPTLTQILTDSPNCYVNASQITGILNIQVDDLKISGGENGYVLTTDGTGNLSWSLSAGSGGSGIVGGTNTQIQFNDSGSFGATGNLVYNKSTKTLTLTGNLVTTNITGNITATSSSQPNITSLGTLVSLNVTGNITSGNADLGNLTISNYFSGDGSLLTDVVAVTSETVTASSQPNITSVGTLSGLIVSGTTRLGTVGNVKITGGTSGQLLTTDGYGNLSWTTVSGTGSMFGNLDVQTFMNANYIPNFTGIIGNAQHANVADLANSIQGSNVDGAVATATKAGTVTTAAQPNITSVGTLLSLNVSGNIETGNADLGNLTISNYFSGNGSLLTSLAGSNVTGVVANATYAISSGSSDTANLVPWSNISGAPTTFFPTRTVKNITSSSLDTDESEDLTISNGFKGYILYGISTSSPAWVTVYSSMTARTDDSTRTITTDPTINSGVIAQVITTSSDLQQYFTPGIIGYSNPASTNIYLKVVNTDTSTATITVTLVLLQLEI